MFRHHLIEESKAELDSAFQEAKRAEYALMERLRSARTAHALDRGCSTEQASRALFAESAAARAELEDLYDLQHAAADRFALISKAHEAVWTSADVDAGVEAALGILYRKSGRQDPTARQVVRGFVEALDRFFHGDLSEQTDMAVRNAWQQVEEHLRRLGRCI